MKPFVIPRIVAEVLGLLREFALVLEVEVLWLQLVDAGASMFVGTTDPCQPCSSRRDRLVFLQGPNSVELS